MTSSLIRPTRRAASDGIEAPAYVVQTLGSPAIIQTAVVRT